MPVIDLELFVHAPAERVFDLSRSVDVHVASTSRTGERAVAGVTTGLLVLGDVVTWEATHFGVRQRLTSQIVALSTLPLPRLHGEGCVSALRSRPLLRFGRRRHSRKREVRL
jgi:hypothetical protein